MKITLMFFLVILVNVTPLFAVEYQVNVVRQGGNLYWAEKENMFIQTEYCFESSDTATVMLRMDGDSGEITFKLSGHKCAVKMIYGQTQLKAGNYSIKVSREDDNWYRIVAKKIGLKTNGCLSLVDNMQANLQINEDGTGILSLPEADEECTVDGVYSQAQLQVK
jgi:SHS2 domain-containing protein